MLIFIDFDGVLHPTPCFQDNVLCRLENLELVLREFPEIELVISSSWRDHYSLPELCDMFSPDIDARVVSVTPSIKTTPPGWMPPDATAYERQFEIEHWLGQNRPQGTKWLAIDDQSHLFKEGCQNLLLIDPTKGFWTSDQPRLREKIKEIMGC